MRIGWCCVDGASRGRALLKDVELGSVAPFGGLDLMGLGMMSDHAERRGADIGAVGLISIGV